MDDQNDSKNEERTLNGHETIFDDEKIVDFLAYNKNEQKNSPRLAHSQECKKNNILIYLLSNLI